MLLVCIHCKQTLSLSLDHFYHPELSGGDMKQLINSWYKCFSLYCLL